MPTTFDTPEQWRSHAKEARALAKQMRDPEAQIAMLRVAESYEKIAKRAEAKLAGKSNQDTARLQSDGEVSGHPE